MPTEKAIVLAAIAAVVLMLIGMATLHERHYKGRRNRLLEAQLQGLGLRVEAIETILREDRLT